MEEKTMNKVINPIIASVILITTILIFSSCSKKTEEKQVQPSLQIEEIKISDRKDVRVKTQEEIVLKVDVHNKGDRQLKYEWSVTGGTIEPADSTINIASCKYISPDTPGMHRVTLKILEQSKTELNLVATKFLDLDVYELPDIFVSNKYISSGWMGDSYKKFSDGSLVVRQTNTRHEDRQCLRVSYRPYNGANAGHWSGVYWLVGSGDDAWRNRVNLQGYEKLEFHAMGSGRENEYVQFKVGDDEGSDCISTGSRFLEGNRWQLIEIDLRGHDLSSVLPFCWVTEEPNEEMVFYITNPVFKFRYEN